MEDGWLEQYGKPTDIQWRTDLIREDGKVMRFWRILCEDGSIVAKIYLIGPEPGEVKGPIWSKFVRQEQQQAAPRDAGAQLGVQQVVQQGATAQEPLGEQEGAMDTTTSSGSNPEVTTRSKKWTL